MSDLLPGSQIIAGDGTETYTVAANGTTFTSGGDSDTFTVTGNNNTFQAGSGPDTFYDTVPGRGSAAGQYGRLLPGGDQPGAPLSVNASGAPETAGGNTLDNGQAAVGSTSPAYTFLNSPTSNSASNFTTITGAGTGHRILGRRLRRADPQRAGHRQLDPVFWPDRCGRQPLGRPRKHLGPDRPYHDAVQLHPRPGSGPGEPTRLGDFVHRRPLGL